MLFSLKIVYRLKFFEIKLSFEKLFSILFFIFNVKISKTAIFLLFFYSNLVKIELQKSIIFIIKSVFLSVIFLNLFIKYRMKINAVFFISGL